MPRQYNHSKHDKALSLSDVSRLPKRLQQIALICIKNGLEVKTIPRETSNAVCTTKLRINNYNCLVFSKSSPILYKKDSMPYLTFQTKKKIILRSDKVIVYLSAPDFGKPFFVIPAELLVDKKQVNTDRMLFNINLKKRTSIGRRSTLPWEDFKYNLNELKALN